VCILKDIADTVCVHHSGIKQYPAGRGMYPTSLVFKELKEQTLRNLNSEKKHVRLHQQWCRYLGHCPHQSVMLNMTEKLVDKHNGQYFRLCPLCQYQLANQPGKSTEATLHNLITYIEEAHFSFSGRTLLHGVS
jgi:hypothetical protein